MSTNSRIPAHLRKLIATKDQAFVPRKAAWYTEVLDKAAAAPKRQRTDELSNYIQHYRTLLVMSSDAPILADQWEMARNDAEHFAEIFAPFV